jgi:uncharacterized protein (TIGR02466 family)
MTKPATAATIDTLFVTHLYRAALAAREARPLNADLEACARSLAVDDEAGIAWSKANGYPGYTSYASLDDLPWRFPAFAELVDHLDGHVSAFAKVLELDLGGAKLVLDDIWVNILPPGGFHGSHLHPHAVVSGTYYVAVPKGAAALKIEDPRLAMMMAAPPKRQRVAVQNRSFVTIAPKPGTLLLWESFLRHEVPLNQGEDDRISVSFNYRWG